MRRLLLALLVTALAGSASAQPEIGRSVLSSGGGTATAAAFSLCSTLGQAVAGIAAGGDVTMSAGYWRGGTQTSGVKVISTLTVPLVYALRRPTPNPFRSSTVIGFEVPLQRSAVDLSVYDVAGRHVRSLYSGVPGPGRQQVQWDGTSDLGEPMGTGAYFIVLASPNTSLKGKVVLLR